MKLLKIVHQQPLFCFDSVKFKSESNARVYMMSLVFRNIEENQSFFNETIPGPQSAISKAIDGFFTYIEDCDSIEFCRIDELDQFSLFQNCVIGFVLLCQSLIQQTWSTIERIMWKYFLRTRKSHTWLFVVESFVVLSKLGNTNIQNHYLLHLFPKFFESGNYTKSHYRIKYLISSLVNSNEIWYNEASKLLENGVVDASVFCYLHCLIPGSREWQLINLITLEKIIEAAHYQYHFICKEIDSVTNHTEAFGHLQSFHLIVEPVFFGHLTAKECNEVLKSKVTEILADIHSRIPFLVNSFTTAAIEMSKAKKNTYHMQQNVLILLKITVENKLTVPTILGELNRWTLIETVDPIFWIGVIGYLKSIQVSSEKEAAVLNF